MVHATAGRDTGQRGWAVRRVTGDFPSRGGFAVIRQEETMTIYSVKLVDHRSSTSEEKTGVCDSIKLWLNMAFTGTADSVAVAWGAGQDSDNFVIHFVEKVDSSYLRKTWPHMKISADAGGHTHTQKKGNTSLSGTELYRVTPSGPLRLRRYGALAFHEAFHNLFPFRDEGHNQSDASGNPFDAFGQVFGGGLAQGIVPDMEPNEQNKDFLRRGFSVRNPQLL